jgi:hypothetical protein
VVGVDQAELHYSGVVRSQSVGHEETQAGPVFDALKMILFLLTFVTFAQVFTHDERTTFHSYYFKLFTDTTISVEHYVGSSLSITCTVFIEVAF